MKVMVLRSRHAKEAMLAVVCIADAVCCLSCGGTGSKVSLSGTGGAPAATLSTTKLSFGSQAVGLTTTAETLTLTNTGSAPLNIASVLIAGANVDDFAEIADTCGISVAAGSACTIGVAFTPRVGGARTATISITDNAPGSPQAVSLSGVGSHDVILSWIGSGTAGIVAYNVYRGTTSRGENSTPLNATPINGNTYVDENVKSGTTYYYVVTAIGANGEQSAPSGETAATVPAD